MRRAQLSAPQGAGSGRTQTGLLGVRARDAPRAGGPGPCSSPCGPEIC